jgi:copper(I)-binding protein
VPPAAAAAQTARTTETTCLNALMIARRHLALWPLAALLLASALPARPQPPGVQVLQPWARPTVAGQGAGGGFLTLRGGDAADRLLGASSPVAQRMELHTMRMEGSVMRMHEVPAIDVPAGQAVHLQPGGLHLMFMGLQAPLQAGSRVPVTLRFEKAGEVRVEMEVSVRPPAGAPAGSPAGGHGGMGGHGAHGGHRP